VLIDRYGPARVNSAMLCIAAAGALVFATAQSVGQLTLGRAMIGLGVAVTLMSAMSAVHAWAPKDKLATFTGLVMTLGGVGAIVASTPTQIAIGHFGWRAIFLAVMVCALVFSLLVFSTRHYAKPAAQHQSWRELLGGVATIFRTPYFWRVSLALLTTLGTMLAFQSLWCATYMRDVAGYTDKQAISNVLVGFNLGMLTTFFVTGAVVDKLASRGFSIQRSCVCLMALAMTVQACILAFPTFAPALMWGLFAFFANGMVAAYPMLAKYFPPALTGRANTALNLVAFLGAFLIQGTIGAVLNLWPVSQTAADTQYAAQGYVWSWLTLLAMQAIMLVVLARARGKNA
jgi:MFS family permease